MTTSNDLPVGDCVPSLPRLGEPAPAIEALSTQGPLRLAELRGKWVILFSHLADFTPVCTTEYLALSKMQEEFAGRNCRLLGLSADSIFAHIAWLRELERLGAQKITFPVIADVDMKVARAYGMLHPGVTDLTVRSVFWIDPESLLRAMSYYPPDTGRSLPEILRMLDALQQTDHENVATGADWQPGGPLIMPAPRTLDAAERRLEEGYESQTWYLSWRK
jgi:peroxiredoxin (alkyl hydroperoxide reductase subunit C)